MTDALGSVVRTESQYGGANFRYTAYGKLMKTTPGYTNYGFGWVGSLGYRQTNLTHSEQYVRARHYSSTESRWTTQAAITSPDSYIYQPRNSSTDKCDLSSVTAYPVQYTTITKPSLEDCGSWGGLYHWEIQWHLKGLPPHAKGWIIQEILVHSVNMTSCVPGYKPCNRQQIHYWEGWWVAYGAINAGWPMTTYSNDYWRDGFSCNCHAGSKVMEGWALFFPVPKECGIPGGKWGWSTTGATWAHGFLSGGQPIGWKRHKDATHRVVNVSANCCKPCVGSAPARCNPTRTIPGAGFP